MTTCFLIRPIQVVRSSISISNVTRFRPLGLWHAFWEIHGRLLTLRCRGTIHGPCEIPPSRPQRRRTCLSESTSQEPTDATFETHGGICPPQGHERADLDVHFLFKGRVHRWRSEVTLAEALRRDTLATRMTINQRIQLAPVIANAYLYLARVKVMCKPITLKGFRSNDLEGEQTALDQFDPLLPMPYIDFGYGQPQGVVIGGTSRPTSLNPIIDLGIIMLQIGRWLFHEYDSRISSSLAEARAWAQSSLKCLDYTFGVDFTEIVHGCIDYEQRTIPGQYEKNQETENEFLLDKVRRLQDLQSKFHSASRAGAMVPVARE
ncbi:hypothetical protein CONLIGDRAFT_643133 [Coniochaeta ligniaria NRRL 30616]|uniref:Prion-inhibition and propagation HeLo domain-containing protein n=1 Tax=Coniochaeta ligniaria NRRL 30616 TaxID=1408157 RepID=A0A1J7IUE3_9PEZI|nr:hypothetical protein CONLIGDRAFT_643133 [Coniochaeta ligniaria NRRL 30616]